MEIKKSPKADLEKKKGVFIQIGLIVVLALVYLAFEWTNSESIDTSFAQMQGEEFIDEEMINTFRDEQPPPPPPPPAAPEEFEVVDDDVEIEDELIIDDSESDEDDIVDIVEVADEEEDEDEIFNFYVLEDKPEFPGGEAELLKWIANNTDYPEIAKENGITGKVFIGFVIGKDGVVTDVKVLRSVDAYLDKEAMRVVKSMPKWKPGKQRGKAVKVSFQVPINFKLY